MDHIQIIKDEIADLKLKYTSTDWRNDEGEKYAFQFLKLEELLKKMEAPEGEETMPEPVHFANWLTCEYSMTKNLFEWKESYSGKKFSTEEMYEKFKAWKIEKAEEEKALRK